LLNVAVDATYDFDVSVDGAAAITVSLATTATSTYDNLVTAINGVLTGVATASIEDGNILITSDTTGTTTSTISMTDVDLMVEIPDFVDFNPPIVGLNVSTSTAAQAAVASLDLATDAIIGVRAGVAATQNRMVRIINTQATVIENLTAAESQIRDADIAAEIALLTRNQILVEAATAMVGQANLIPQSVLQLLG
jgi:flagellin